MDQSKNGGDAIYKVDWDVSDPDGDLAEVTLELEKSDGTVVDSKAIPVSGCTAPGRNDELRDGGEGNQ